MSTEFLAESGLRRDRDPRRMNDDGMLARRILFHYYSNTLTKMPSRANPIQNLVLVIPPTILQSSNYTSIYNILPQKESPRTRCPHFRFFPSRSAARSERSTPTRIFEAFHSWTMLMMFFKAKIGKVHSAVNCGQVNSST